MPNLDRYEGGCLCREVAFTFEGRFDAFFLCHCSNCRHESGTAHGAKLFSSSGKISWQLGEKLVKSYQKSGTRYSRAFCQQCGGSIPIHQKDIGWVVPAGSLIDPVPIPPTAHIHHSSRANWDNDLHTLKVFQELPQ